MRAALLLETPMILRNLQQVKLDKNGVPTIDSRAAKLDGIEDGSHNHEFKRFFLPIPHLYVYEFELYFADSYRLYGIEYIRARNILSAKKKIRKQYPNVVKFKWSDLDVES